MLEIKFKQLLYMLYEANNDESHIANCIIKQSQHPK
jgi:hypothetical protein